MKYSSINQLSDFEFHDAEFILKCYDDFNLYATAKYLNVHKDAKENPYEYDMEIEYAHICFEHIETHSFKLLPAYQFDAEGKLYTNDPQVIDKGTPAQEKFITELKRGISLHCVDVHKENNRTVLEITTNGRSCFHAIISFDNIIIAWDNYHKKAWYELHKQ